MNLQFPTRDELHRACQAGEEAIVELFARVEQQVRALAQQLEAQAAVLKEVQARLEKTSANSSKPPSSDGYAKPNGRPACGNRVKSRVANNPGIGARP
jgi:hypothetical protein